MLDLALQICLYRVRQKFSNTEKLKLLSQFHTKKRIILLCNTNKPSFFHKFDR